MDLETSGWKYVGQCALCASPRFTRGLDARCMHEFCDVAATAGAQAEVREPTPKEWQTFVSDHMHLALGDSQSRTMDEDLKLLNLPQGTDGYYICMFKKQTDSPDDVKILWNGMDGPRMTHVLQRLLLQVLISNGVQRGSDMLKKDIDVLVAHIQHNTKSTELPN